MIVAVTLSVQEVEDILSQHLIDDDLVVVPAFAFEDSDLGQQVTLTFREVSNEEKLS